jgi:spermidine synthase
MEAFAEDRDLALNLRDLELLDSCDGPPQDVRLFRHPQLGRVLVINKEIQHVESWQALYHEPLVHLPASFVPTIRDGLILGGGSLFAAHELLKYPSLRRCVLVDHDPRVIEMMRHHYPHARAVLEDGRFEFAMHDITEFLKSSSDRFDILINDSVDLFTESSARKKLVELMKSRIYEDGVCADIIYRHLLESDYIRGACKSLKSVQPTAYSLIVVPEYPGVLHLLAVWGNRHVNQQATKTRNLIQQQWIDGKGRPALQFYNPGFMRFYLYLPPYVSTRMRTFIR